MQIPFTHIALITVLSLQMYYMQSQCIASSLITRTCPCAMVPQLTEDTDVKQVIKAFKKSSPRGQRSQLEGFINQYVSNSNEVTEAVLFGCAREYSKRMGNNNVSQLVEDLIRAKVKKPAQKKALLAIGKILKNVKNEYCAIRALPGLVIEEFKQAIAIQQRVRLLRYAQQYASEPSDYLEAVLVGCAQVYCDRVQSQVVNKFIHQLIVAYDKDAVVVKLRQVLSLRKRLVNSPYER